MTKSRYKEVIKDNDKYELNDLRSFMKTESWNAIPKAEKEAILRRVRFLEKDLKLDSKPYNG